MTSDDYGISTVICIACIWVERSHGVPIDMIGSLLSILSNKSYRLIYLSSIIASSIARLIVNLYSHQMIVQLLEMKFALLIYIFI